MAQIRYCLNYSSSFPHAGRHAAQIIFGQCVMMGTVTMGFLFGQPVVAIIESAVHALIDPKTLSLSVVVSLILVLSLVWKKPAR